jgi:hypothetical protein
MIVLHMLLPGLPRMHARRDEDDWRTLTPTAPPETNSGHNRSQDPTYRFSLLRRATELEQLEQFSHIRGIACA